MSCYDNSPEDRHYSKLLGDYLDSLDGGEECANCTAVYAELNECVECGKMVCRDCLSTDRATCKRCEDKLAELEEMEISEKRKAEQ